ncbi:ligand-gated ion channel domain-containing protein [Phthorimaea operculella]|nr:ligand-gated ion channel domain-containing protein [Phthorimaea operculella]
MYFCSHTCGQRSIGAIFTEEEVLLKAAFIAAFTEVNKDFEETPFEIQEAEVALGDLASAESAACELLEKRVFGIIGPQNKDTLQHVQSIADYYEIPHILLHPDETHSSDWFAVNLYPSHIVFSQIFVDIIQAKGWEEFTIIYEGAETLPFLDNILNMQDIVSGDRIKITVVQLPETAPSGDDDYRIQLKTIKASESVNYLVQCNLDKLQIFLTQAQQVGLMADPHSYIIMNPDLHTIDIEPYMHGGANITGIRFFDLKEEHVQNFRSSVNDTVLELTKDGEPLDLAENALTFNLAMIHDAVILKALAINATELEAAPEVKCTENNFWDMGSTVLNCLRNMEIDGITGPVSFDESGFRSDFEVDVIELGDQGLEMVGTWNQEDGYTLQRPVKPVQELEGSDSMKGKHFIVLTALSAPYGMLKESAKELEGNDRYEGFGIELIDELAKMNEFNYTFEIQEDGVYGSLDKATGKWNGMMEKVMDGRVDFAITDLTITAARQKAVDFTSPFMNLGITILYKKPTKEPPNLFSFISPFSYEVWGWVAGAYVGVSVLMFLLGRMASEEWQNPYPCIEDPETLDNQFTLANSFWFTLGSLLTQGSEIAPIAVSTRMAGSMWWFFTLIMVSSYTANLAAFLTVESKFYAIKSVQDLAQNPFGITYGAKKGGATLGFFKESDNLLYQKMYEYMVSHPEYQTSSNDEGLARVKSTEENYAFLMESTSIEYMVERNCDVAQVGGLLDSKGYGIAMKQDSPYRQPMSESILQLQEEGKLTRMKDKWWKEKRGGGACADDDEGGGDAQPLVLANVGGVFIVLVAGSAMAVVSAFLEMMVDVWMISRKEKVPFKEELIAELKFVFSFSGDVKPVRHRESTGSGSGGSKKSKKSKEEELKNEDVESHVEEPEVDDAPPTPKSHRSGHSLHPPHSRKQSIAMVRASSRRQSENSRRPSMRIRKYSGRV